MDIIGIDCNKAIRQSEDLKTLARQLSAEITQLENLVSKIKNEWRGPASEEFQKKILALIENMKTTRNTLQNTGYSVRGVANYYQNQN